VDRLHLHGRHGGLDGARLAGGPRLRPVPLPVPAVPRQRGPAAADLHHPARPAGARAQCRPAVHAHLRGRRGDPGRLRADPEPSDGAGHSAGERRGAAHRASGDAGPGRGADRVAAHDRRRVRRDQRQAGRLAHAPGGHDDGVLRGADRPGRLDGRRSGLRVRPVSVRVPAVPVEPDAAAADVRDHGWAAGDRAGSGPARGADLPERGGCAACLRAAAGPPACSGPGHPSRRRAPAAVPGRPERPERQRRRPVTPQSPITACTSPLATASIRRW
jgi:hypothetical protein